MKPGIQNGGDEISKASGSDKENVCLVFAEADQVACSTSRHLHQNRLKSAEEHSDQGVHFFWEHLKASNSELSYPGPLIVRIFMHVCEHI